MPFKDKQKAREYQRIWHQKYRERYKKQDAARSKSFRKFKETQPCSVRDCGKTGERHHNDYGKPLEIVWLCKLHHEEAHHEKMKKGCSICGEKHFSRGYCVKHYKSVRATNEEDFRLRRNELERKRYWMKKSLPRPT